MNVWVALSHRVHRHHLASLGWFQELDPRATLIFCRQTQMGWFRLLTSEAVMQKEALTQRECWALYEKWISAGKAELWSESAGVQDAFRRGSMAEERSPKIWTDAFLAGFAEAASLTLVTFDKALAGKAKGAVLLS